jgi:hypothetical protein
MAIGVIAFSLAPGIRGQGASTASSKANSKWTAARTADGQPDLQGVWTNATITPFERPKEFADKAYLTPQEALTYEERVLRESNRDQRGKTPEADVGGAYNEVWFERGTRVVSTLRTSLVIDPQDGKLPALTPEAKQTMAARDIISRRNPEGPEDMALPVRCLLWPTAGPPMLPSGYNNNYRIVQSPGYVAILVEMIHDVRIIPLDGRPHLPSNVRQWMGDSRGHWEGDTLVVDTTNFTNKTHFRNADEKLHLTERFTRTSPNTILYQFTVDDPTAFTKSWTGEVPFTKSEAPLFEYACHEGNYSMTTMLRGARMQDKAAALRKDTK